jgi:hypothetical protein
MLPRLAEAFIFSPLYGLAASQMIFTVNQPPGTVLVGILARSSIDFVMLRQPPFQITGLPDIELTLEVIEHIYMEHGFPSSA